MDLEVLLDGATYSLVRPPSDLLRVVDATWPALRPEGAEHAGWVWHDILRGREDRFAVLDSGGEAVALWCALKGTPLTLHDGTYYRVDYLEVHPRWTRRRIGTLAVTAIAARAREIGAEGVVLQALPQAVPFWERFAIQRLPKPWKRRINLIPYVIEPQDVVDFSRIFHGNCIPKGHSEG